ncbi:hypothetical protein ACKKBG_A05490 [Auxenochlorella protothecoides x Auxenochlorella symbiontica]
MGEEDIPSVQRISDALFASIANQNQLTEDHLVSLSVVFGKLLPKALRTLDTGGVFCFQGEPSGRSVYHIQGQSGSEPYLVYPEHFCECHAFQFDVLTKQDAVLCKHQLAARLACSLGTLRTSTVSDLVIADLLLQPPLRP